MGNKTNKKYIMEPLNAIITKLEREKGSHIIVGNTGVGKTTILQKLVEQKKGYFMLTAADFAFLSKELNNEELDHFMELTVFSKIYDQLEEENQAMFIDKKIEVESELSTFYNYLLGSEEKPNKYYSFTENIAGIKAIAESDKLELIFVFDNFHQIPRNIRTAVEKYSAQFETRIITMNNDSELLVNFPTSAKIIPSYSRENDFLIEYVSGLVQEFTMSTMNREYLPEVRDRAEKNAIDFIKLIGEARFEKIVDGTKGDLCKLKEIITNILLALHSFGDVKTSEIISAEHSYQKSLLPQ